MRRRLLLPTLAIVSGLLSSGCAQELSSRGAYDGPLTVKGREGAAHRVVECDDGPAEGGNSFPGPYDDGSLSDDAESAIRAAFREGVVSGVADGYDLVREDRSRKLFTFTDEGRVRQALIVHDGEAFGDEGWYVESWARCDYAELPPEVAAEAGYEVWSDTDGRVSTRRIYSAAGPEHCDWDDMTFLEVGDDEYVRVPGTPDPDLARHFGGTFAPAVALPVDARDSGFHRSEDHLWLAPDGAWAYVGDRRSVERWPRVVEPLGCM